MSSSLWLASNIVLPSDFSSSRIFRISRTPSLSSPLKGSSRTKSCGSSIIAWAMPRRCRIPKEYFPTGFFISGSRPTFLSTIRTSAFVILRFMPASISRFLRPVKFVRKPGVSMMTPRLSGKSMSFPICLPNTRIVPVVTVRKPQMHFINTVFPEPLFPTIPYTLPAAKSRLTSLRTKSSPNRFVTWQISIQALSFFLFSMIISFYSSSSFS